MSSKHTDERTGDWTGSTGPTPRVERLTDATGIGVWDPIEEARVELYTGSEPTVRGGDPDRLHFPVDEAVSFTTDRIEARGGQDVRVRDGGELVEYVDHTSSDRVGTGSYDVELGGHPLKVYVGVDAAVEVESLADGFRLAFPEATTVTLGVRSLHERPAGTVTTTADPRDLMRAVSTFGSALKTHAPMRSYPTLRGHPPSVEIGDAFDAPEGIEPPDTDVRIEVPDTVAHAFSVASLAYYAAATVEPGSEPVLVADGERFPLAPDGVPVERGVARTLERLVTLDSFVRDHSLYPAGPETAGTFRERYDGDLDALREGPLADRTAAAMRVDRETFADLVPTWGETYDVTPEPSNAAALPFAADALAHVRPVTEDDRGPAPGVPPESVESFFRAAEVADEPEAFALPAADSDAHTYVGEGIPVGAAGVSPSTLARRHERVAPESDSITVDVVCNDPRMLDEPETDPYGLRDALSYDIETHRDLTVAQLRDLLSSGSDFFHFVGHVDDQGLQCADGALDARTLGYTGVKAFFLNACNSATQAVGLVEAGSRGGVATVSDVPNAVATQAGRTIARLFNAGATLHSAVALAKREYLSGHGYTVVGDGNARLTQTGTGLFTFAELEDDDDGYRVRSRARHGAVGGPGTLVRPTYREGSVSLAGNFDEWTPITGAELAEAAVGGSFPVFYRNELRWSDEFGET